jgi:hypothetical protein
VSELVVYRSEAEYLAAVAQMRELVDQIASVEGAKELAAQARAAEVYAKRAKLGRENELRALVVRRYAERRAGELLIAMRDGAGRLPDRTVSELNISRVESHRWQKLAALDDEAFEAMMQALVVDVEREGPKAARVKRMRATRERNAAREAEALAKIRELGEDAYELTVADLASWRPGEVDAIITDPPYIGENVLALYFELRDFAVETLRPGGALVVMTSQRILDGVFATLTHDRLAYRWTIAWTFATHENTVDHPRRVFDHWKPVLVYHRDAMPDDAPVFYDVVVNEDADKSLHEWGQSLDGMAKLVRYFAAPSSTVCDPFLGAGTTAVAALEHGCRFVGCDVDELAVVQTRKRLERGTS